MKVLKEYDKGSLDFMVETMAGVVADLRDEFTKDINSKIAALERSHQKEIANLKEQLAADAEPIAWKIDSPGYRAIPFFANGKPGKAN